MKTRRPTRRDAQSSTRTTSAIESLEARRLFSTYTVTGTANADAITVDSHTELGLPYYTITVNGQTQNQGPGNPAGNIVVINGLGGNDIISVLGTCTGDLFSVHPGAGDDIVLVGNGNFGGDIDGTVNVFEQPNEGNDSLEIVDSLDGTGTHDTVHVGAFQMYADESLTTDATVGWDDQMESVTLNCSSQADVVDVDAPTPNVTLSLGNGANTLRYGGSSHVLFGTVSPMTVLAGVNTDTVIFDDSGGGATPQTYDFTPTAALNQSLTGIENIELDTRAATGNFNTINVNGDPTNGLGTGITINGGNAHLSIGQQASPFASSEQLQLHINVGGTVAYWDQGAVGVDNTFLFTTISPTQLLLAKVNFTNISWGAGIAVNLSLNGGPTNDTFTIDAVSANSSITINGGDGDDEMHNGAGHGNVLTSAFAGTYFDFNGGDGLDSVDLSDSDAPTSGGNQDYFVGPSSAAKGPNPGYISTGLVNYTTDQLVFTADNGNNFITYSDTYGQQFTIKGGGGNDFFLNNDNALDNLVSTAYGISLVGGAGVDTAQLDDESAFGVTQYALDPGIVSFSNGPSDQRTLSYDNTMENLELDESDSNATTFLRGNYPNVNPTIYGDGGDDLFVVGGGDLDSNGMNNVFLNGGAGINSIRFDDTLDAYSPFEDETVQLNGSQLDKGPVTVNYSNFQLMEFDASSTISGPLDPNPPEIVNLNTTSGMPTSLIAGFNRNAIVNISNPNPIAGNLTSIDAPVTVTLGAAGSMAVNDQASTGNTGYTLTSTQVTTSTGKTINYSGGDGVTLNANGGLNFIQVKSSSSAAPFIINGAAGDDIVSVGNGNFDANIHSNVTFNGDAGSDQLVIDNTTDNTLESQSIDGTSFTDGKTVSTSGVENFELNTGPGGGTVNVNALGFYAFLDGNSGPDTINVGTGNLDTTLGADMLIWDAELVTLDDHLTGAADIYNFGNFGFRKNNAGHTVGFNNVGNVVLKCNDLSNMINVSQFSTPLTILGNGGSDTLNETGAAFTVGPNVTFDGGAAEDTVNVNPGSGGGSPVCTLAANYQDLVTINVGANGKLVIPTNSIADVSTVFSLGGVIDMAGGALIKRNAGGQLTQFLTRIKNGYANGAWNGTTGPSINSSLAASTALGDGVGFANSGALFPTFPATFMGVSVNSSDMLVRYTRYGDADLDGDADGVDIGRWATHFTGELGGTGSRTWSDGDWDYDGDVDGVDAGRWSQSFSGELGGGGLGSVQDTPFSRTPISRQRIAQDVLAQ
ncbi:MAG TPA: hypothetical protein VH518_00605 [Tepidisphaeraceae bacterium]